MQALSHIHDMSNYANVLCAITFRYRNPDHTTGWHRRAQRAQALTCLSLVFSFRNINLNLTLQLTTVKARRRVRSNWFLMFLLDIHTILIVRAFGFKIW